jgi:hypothetical protein
MDRCKPTVEEMRALSFAVGVVIIATAWPLDADARENTTAVWSDGHTSSLTDEELMKYAIASPGPGYPEEAQKSKVVGSGLYELRINQAGKVTDVAIVKVFVRVRLPVTWAANKLN